MLECSHLSAVLADGTPLFTDLSFTLNEGDRIALVGEEGDGKSTLLKILAGETLDYVQIAGFFHTDWTIARLPQQIEPAWLSQPPMDYLLKENPDTDIPPEAWAQCPALARTASELGFDQLYSETPIATLSGGEKVRLMLLKIIHKDPDCYFLDEPANDLDLDTLAWLENWITTCRQPVLMVSHDVHLIRTCARTILHLELRDKKTKPVWTLFQGTYDDYIAARRLQRQKQARQARSDKLAYEKQKARLNNLYNKVNGKLNTVSRQAPHKGQVLKKKMKSVLSSQQNLERTERTRTDSAEEEISFWLPDVPFPPGKKIIDRTMEVSVADRPLVAPFALSLYGPVRLGITGPNGCGKTTLLKQLYQILQDNPALHAGWMPQDYDSAFHTSDTPITFLQRFCDDVTLLRTRLGSLRFTPREMEQSVFDLSGGQKAKLILASLALRQCDVLLLDEPTRNLSPLSVHVLIQALEDCPCALIAVSHDRAFLDQLFDRRASIRQGKWHWDSMEKSVTEGASMV